MSEWMECGNEKKILICVRDFIRTGVPVASMNLAVLLKKMGYRVLFVAMGTGSLEEKLSQIGIDFVANISGFYENEAFLALVQRFDLIIMGTLVTANVGWVFSRLGLPIMWWLHESLDWLYKDYELPVEMKNIRFFAGGKRVVNKFKEYYPNQYIDELLYYLPESQIRLRQHANVKTFACIGTIEKRKAQDVFIEAVKGLPENIKSNCVFYIIGSALDDDKTRLEEICNDMPCIRYVSEMKPDELDKFYEKIDVLVCPSRDDPMPIVVTQAFQHGVPCIISDEVGQCEYIQKMGGGVVFPSEDVGALKKRIMDFCSLAPEEVAGYAEDARKIFDMHFSERHMRDKLEKILADL
jgi:glycosyltransferase involved in cell wall biosynthesis